MSGYDTSRPYAAAYLVVRRDNKVAFVLRSNTNWMNGHYGLPSGKVEKQESFTGAAVREGAEEIGIEVKPGNLKFVHAMQRSTQDENSEWVDMFFEPIDYKGEPYNAEPDIHGELVWLDPSDLPENVVPSVKYALQQIEQGHLYSEFGWDA